MLPKRRCTRCDCPLTCLLREDGGTEGRSICVRCKNSSPKNRKPKEYIRARDREKQIRSWKKANTDRVRQHARDWYERHKETVNAKRKQLRIDNPEAVRQAAREYYANREKRAAKKKEKQPINKESKHAR